MKSNNGITGKSVFACPICKKQIKMNEAVYITDSAECFGGGTVAHYFCVIDSLQRDFERTHKAVKIYLDECDNAESLVLEREHTAPAADISDAYLYGLLGLEVNA
jgi:hypothetical protein